MSNFEILEKDLEDFQDAWWVRHVNGQEFIVTRSIYGEGTGVLPVLPGADPHNGLSLLFAALACPEEDFRAARDYLDQPDHMEALKRYETEFNL